MLSKLTFASLIACAIFAFASSSSAVAGKVKVSIPGLGSATFDCAEDFGWSDEECMRECDAFNDTTTGHTCSYSGGIIHILRDIERTERSRPPGERTEWEERF